MRSPMRSVAGVLLLSIALAAQTPPAPSEPYRDRIAREGPVIRLRVEEALRMALENNLDITIEKLNVATAVWQLSGARGFYDPALSFTANRAAGHSIDPNPNSPNPISASPRTSSVTPSVSFNLPTGGTLNSSLSNSRTYSFFSSTLNPSYTSLLTVDFSQPLLRGGFSGASGPHQIIISRFAVTQSREGFRQRVIGIVQQVLSAYFELLFSIENYETRRRARDLAAVQFENTRLRVQSGFLAGSALTAARLEVALREQDWISSEVQIVNSQNALRALLSTGRASDVWKSALLPVTPPDTSDPHMSLEEALNSAHAHRPELSLAALQRQQNLENTRFAANQRLPQVNFNGNITSPGSSGVLVAPIEGLDPASGQYLGGYGSSLPQSFGFIAPGWSLGLSVQFPLRNRAAEAAYAQSQIADRRLAAQEQNTLLNVDNNVMSTWQALSIQRNNLRASQLAREAAEEQVVAITARFEANLSTNFEVLSYQRDLANAQVSELRARIDYQNALNNLMVAAGQLLEANSIVLPKIP